jgi:hypothetical protein
MKSIMIIVGIIFCGVHVCVAMQQEFVQPTDRKWPIHAAIMANDFVTVKQLILSGRPVNESNDIQQTPLHIATQCRNTKIANWLLEKYAEVSAQDGNGNTALHIAARQNFIDIVCTLLGAGAWVDATNNLKETALHVAASQGHVAIIKLLLSAKANAGIKNHVGQTAYNMAMANNQLPAARILGSARLFYTSASVVAMGSARCIGQGLMLAKTPILRIIIKVCCRVIVNSVMGRLRFNPKIKRDANLLSSHIIDTAFAMRVQRKQQACIIL